MKQKSDTFGLGVISIYLFPICLHALTKCFSSSYEIEHWRNPNLNNIWSCIFCQRQYLHITLPKLAFFASCSSSLVSPISSTCWSQNTEDSWKTFCYQQARTQATKIKNSRILPTTAELNVLRTEAEARNSRLTTPLTILDIHNCGNQQLQQYG